MFGGRQKTATGIHFSGSKARMVGLFRRRAGLVLAGAAEEELTRPFAPGDLAVAECRQELVEVLGRLCERAGIDLDRPTVAVDPHAALIKPRPLLVPGPATRATRRANLEQLDWETQQLLGEGRGEYTIDYLLLPESGFLVAVRRQLVELYCEVLTAAGASDVEVDLEPFALHNAAEAVGLLDGTGVELLLQVREDGVQAVVLRDGVLSTVVRCGADGTRPGELTELAEVCGRRLHEECSGESVHRAWVAGERAEELAELLASRLASPCMPFDPFLGMELDDRGDELSDALAEGPAFGVAAGLACRRLLP